MSKLKGTKVNKTPGFGCNACDYKSDNIAHHPYVNGDRPYHCYECNELFIIDYKAEPHRQHKNHNWNNQGSVGVCKMLKNNTFKCAVCEFDYPKYPHAVKTYKTILDDTIDLMMCLRCSRQIGGKLQERKGWRYAPMWMWATIPSHIALQYFVIMPMWGMDMNIGGLLGAVAIPGLLIWKWKEWV